MSSTSPRKEQSPAQLWLEAFSHLQRREPTERRLELARMADATRRVIEALVSAKIPAEEIAQAAKLIEDAADAVERFPRISGFAGFSESANAGDTSLFFDRSPIIGQENPIAPPLHFEPKTESDGSVVIVGGGRFGAAYEGPPGHVHGGYIAAAFDEVCGMAQSLSGTPGMTVHLEVDYRKPTPLHTDLRFEGRLLRVEGRKIFTKGVCLVDGVLTAEASALFVSVDFSLLAAGFANPGAPSE
ncbi:MAG: PaaI family thioesterase [Acidimicrobiales bacterium]